MNDLSHKFPRAPRLSEPLQQIMAMQAIEANPLSDDQIAMFEMFEREGWSPEKCIEHIRGRAKALAGR
jgi:hypothetical protein